jgi:hypothetical protein
MPALDGEWNVIRTGGLLPPLVGLRKRIHGERGETALGPLPGMPFTVDGLALRYHAPFNGFVDVLEPDGSAFRGRALFRGREFGRFELRRVA